MSEIGTVPRFVRRLSEGAQRERLIAPILSARPALVVLSAPSGYGKTVLAAQIASSGFFSEVVWIRSAGTSGSLRDCLEQVAERLSGKAIDQERQSLPEICHVCSDALAAMPDQQSTLLVFDDSSWAADQDSLQLLAEVLSDAPMGTTALITTRQDVPARPHKSSAWVLTTPELMLSEAEIGEIWNRHARVVLTPAEAVDVAGASGRHAALVSLMARHAALSGSGALGPGNSSPSVASLLASLVMDQLEPEEQRLLDFAAVLGQGTEETLSQVARIGDLGTALSRIANAMPLVALSSDGARRRFEVHDLVAEACDSVRRLNSADVEGLSRAIEAMASRGDHGRAMTVAVQTANSELVTQCLRQVGTHLIKCAAWELVRSAIELLAPEVIAADPTLMMISAEVAWSEGRKSDAIRQATLAVRLGELSGDDCVPGSARSLLAAMRVSDADYAGAVADLAPLLGAYVDADPNDLADTLYAAIMAHGFLGDRQGLQQCLQASSAVFAESSVGSFRIARLHAAMGVVADCLDGDHRRSMELLEGAASRSDVPQHWRFRTLSNLSACALECGETDRVRSAHAAMAAIGSAFSTPLDRSLPVMIAAVMNVMESRDTNLRDAVDDVVSLCEAEGEAFTLAVTCSVASQATLAMGDAQYARRLSEKGLIASAATGSPVLLWLAELINAQVALSTGLVDRAGSAARRILPLAQSIDAMGHVLHCRLLLAEVSLRQTDFAQAIEHLSTIADHVVRTTPALTLASYVRAFPDLLGALALAIGVEALPERFFGLIRGTRGDLALEQAAGVLARKELEVLAQRMRASDSAADPPAADPDGTCHVRLFGGLQVVTPRGQVGERDWSKRKARLLFAMLVSRMGTDVPRGEIIEYLWPDMPEERALNNFYVVWSAMKRAICPESVRDTPCPYVEHVRGVCRIVKQRVVSDLEEFSGLLSTARTARRDGDTDRELTALRALADIYTGEVLPGDVYDDWFAPLRDRFRHDFEDAMLRASQVLEEQGDPHGGLQLLRRAMAADPWREDLYQAQLRMQIAAGQRSAAIETYMLCRSRLTADLGIDPSRETTALYEQVLGMEEPDGLSRV